MSESASWGTLRKMLVRNLLGCDIQRIEDKLATGVPDANVCWKGSEIWLEGKQMRELPARSNTAVRVGLTQDQLNWARSRIYAGGRSAVWVRINNVGWWLFTGLQDMERLLGVKKPFYTKEEFLDIPHDKTCRDFVQRIKGELWK